jgi:hypothetical protein
MYDYRCKKGHTASSTRTPTNTYYWERISVASTTGGYTYTTNVRESGASAWASGASVSAGQAVYDSADRSDYVASVAVSAGDNTIRPSEAVLSSTTSVASRWVRIGNANAWAWNDYEISSRLEGYNSSNVLVNPAFTIDCGILSYAVNAICFSGMLNVQDVEVKIYVDSVLTETITKDLTTGAYNSTSAALYFTAPVEAGDNLKIAVTLSRDTLNLPPTVGAIVVGDAKLFAYTEWDVETSIINYSRRERDQTYGTIKFVPRGSAKSLRATCFVDNNLAPADWLLQHLAWLSGAPIYFDFNNDAADYDRLRIFGICTKASSSIKTDEWEILSIEVEGLVE